MNTAYGSPILFDSEKTLNISRIELTEKTFDEKWIQNKLFDNPTLLPLKEINSSYIPLVAVGKEVIAGDGRIDLLFVNPMGEIVLVETKLWRNPEARREVVGQVVEYAKEISKWDYTELSKKVSTSNNIINLYEYMKQALPNTNISEKEFIDGINTNLKRGKVLLVICGDGIRENIKEMNEYLNKTATLEFCLALVELQVYKVASNEMSMDLIIPKLTTRIKEDVRAVIRIEGDNIKSVSAEIIESDEFETGEATTRQIWDEATFFIDMENKVSKEYWSIIKDLYNFSQESAERIDWGTSARRGSFSPKYTLTGNNCGPFSVYSDGNLFIKFWFDKTKESSKKMEMFYRNELKKINGFELAETKHIFEVKIVDWADKLNEFQSVINNLKNYCD